MVSIKTCNPKCWNPDQPQNLSKNLFSSAVNLCPLRFCAHTWTDVMTERDKIYSLDTVLSCMSSNWAPLACCPISDGSSSVACGNRETLGQGGRHGIQVFSQDFRNDWDWVMELCPSPSSFPPFWANVAGDIHWKGKTLDSGQSLRSNKKPIICWLVSEVSVSPKSGDIWLWGGSFNPHQIGT